MANLQQHYGAAALGRWWLITSCDPLMSLHMEVISSRTLGFEGKWDAFHMYQLVVSDAKLGVVVHRQ